MARPLDAPINRGGPRLADEPLDWRFKGLPAQWWGQTPAQICAAGSRTCSTAGAVGPVCVLRGRRADAQPRRDGRVVPRARRRAGPARQDAHVAAAVRPPARRGRVRDHRGHHQPGAHLPRVRRARADPGQRARRRRPDCAGWPPNWTPTRLRAGVLGGLGARCRADDRRTGRRRARRRRRLRRGRHAGRAHRLPRRGRRRRGRARGRGVAAAAAGRCRGIRGGARPRRRRRRGRRAVARLPADDARGGACGWPPLFETDERHRHRGRQHLLRRGRRCADRLARRPVGTHDPAQRLLPDPRRRAVPAHLAADP